MRTRSVEAVTVIVAEDGFCVVVLALSCAVAVPITSSAETKAKAKCLKLNIALSPVKIMGFHSVLNIVDHLKILGPGGEMTSS